MTSGASFWRQSVQHGTIRTFQFGRTVLADRKRQKKKRSRDRDAMRSNSVTIETRRDADRKPENGEANGGNHAEPDRAADTVRTICWRAAALSQRRVKPRRSPRPSKAKRPNRARRIAGAMWPAQRDLRRSRPLPRFGTDAASNLRKPAHQNSSRPRGSRAGPRRNVVAWLFERRKVKNEDPAAEKSAL